MQKRGRFEAQVPGMESDNTQKPMQSKQADFMPEIRVATKDLPSKGVSYPKDSWIKHRPYMFGEVTQISGSKLDTRTTYEHILSGVECSFDKSQLTVPDVLYIGLLRKISTLGSTEIVARYNCPKCKKPGQLIFKTDDLEFDELEVPKMPIVADMSFGEAHFSPMTVKDFLELADKHKESDEIALYAIQTRNMGFEEAYKKYYNANPEDSQTLIEIDRLLFHSLKPFTRKCTNLLPMEKTEIGGAGAGSQCGHPIKIELDGGQALLLPFRRNEGPTKTKIRFGLEDER